MKQYVCLLWSFSKYLRFYIILEFFASVNIRIWPLYFILWTITIIGSFKKHSLTRTMKDARKELSRFSVANFYQYEEFTFIWQGVCQGIRIFYLELILILINLYCNFTPDNQIFFLFEFVSATSLKFSMLWQLKYVPK